MSDLVSHPGWVGAIVRRVRERDIRRQILYNHVRKVSADSFLANRAANRIPALLPEYLKMVTGSVLGFWIIATVLEYLFHAKPLYLLPVFGLIYSMQTIYYKHRLSVDPGYKIPRCRCAGRGSDDTEIVLQSRESAILGIPNSVLGAVYYPVLLLLVSVNHTDTAMGMATGAVLVSLYLSYVMVARIAKLCVNCINLAALNGLILWQFLR
jgi:uncharacterized membrane protein